jgi:hypothetical protein
MSGVAVCRSGSARTCARHLTVLSDKSARIPTKTIVNSALGSAGYRAVVTEGLERRLTPLSAMRVTGEDVKRWPYDVSSQSDGGDRPSVNGIHRSTRARTSGRSGGGGFAATSMPSGRK